MTRALALVAVLGCKGNETAPAPEVTVAAAVPAPAIRLSQVHLPSLPALEPADDPSRASKIAIGKKLFADACLGCHQARGTGGHGPSSIRRHAPSLWNVAYLRGALFWDGRARSLDDVTADSKPAESAALVEYERTLICNATAYDRYAAGDKAALTAPQQRGLDVFLGKGQCVVCHAPPYFSTAMAVDGGAFFNTGVGTQVPEHDIDPGRMKVTNDARDWAAFKPPSLRNVARRAPYFHDGSAATLDDAVERMAAGGIANKNRNPILADRGLTDAERADLVAFLDALDCPGSP